jgi:hypothetical protein
MERRDKPSGPGFHQLNVKAWLKRRIRRERSSANGPSDGTTLLWSRRQSSTVGAFFIASVGVRLLLTASAYPARSCSAWWRLLWSLWRPSTISTWTAGIFMPSIWKRFPSCTFSVDRPPQLAGSSLGFRGYPARSANSSQSAIIEAAKKGEHGITSVPVAQSVPMRVSVPGRHLCQCRNQCQCEHQCHASISAKTGLSSRPNAGCLLVKYRGRTS